MTPDFNRAIPALITQTLDIESAAAATWNTPPRSCAGQLRALGQRMSASPSLAGANVVPLGTCCGHDEFAF